jgi:Mlc titration factor MtfA (ptsG expression regulator)
MLATRTAQWHLLDTGERARLGELADELLTSKRWEAARGFELTEAVRTTIAAQASLLILELDIEHYAEVGTIVVRAGAMRRAAPVPGWGRVDGIVDGSPAPVDGEAHHRDGPVMINWATARRELLNPRWGHDVILHEFAHKLDMLDATVDGTPPITDEAQRRRWIEVCTAEFEALRRGEAGTLLRPYAATNPGEFFAVATETLFTRPVALYESKPDLYRVLAEFYRQDPRVRSVGRGRAPTAAPA